MSVSQLRSHCLRSLPDLVALHAMTHIPRQDVQLLDPARMPLHVQEIQVVESIPQSPWIGCFTSTTESPLATHLVKWILRPSLSLRFLWKARAESA